jgi:hypothetical protein
MSWADICADNSKSSRLWSQKPELTSVQTTAARAQACEGINKSSRLCRHWQELTSVQTTLALASLLTLQDVESVQTKLRTQIIWILYQGFHCHLMIEVCTSCFCFWNHNSSVAILKKQELEKFPPQLLITITSSTSLYSHCLKREIFWNYTKYMFKPEDVQNIFGFVRARVYPHAKLSHLYFFVCFH